MVATYKKVPEETRSSMPTHKPRSCLAASSSFDSLRIQKAMIEQIGDVRVKARTCRNTSPFFNFIWFKKVPRPSVAGILCIKIAKKMTMPSWEEEFCTP